MKAFCAAAISLTALSAPGLTPALAGHGLRAEEISSLCAVTADMAQAFMQARQDGQELIDVMGRISDQPEVTAAAAAISHQIALSAFRLERGESPEARRVMVAAFRTQIETTCLRDLGEPGLSNGL